MMSLETIRSMSQDAARKAARAGKIPLIFEAEDKAIDGGWEGRMARAIPNLGTHVPRGWRRVHITRELFDGVRPRGVNDGDADRFGAFFVDASGFGADDEPALTFDAFRKAVKPGYGYAIVEVGPFQVKVGAFARRSAARAGASAAAEGVR